MIYDYFGGVRYPLKQGLALEFCKNKHKVTSILTQTHINHDQIHHIKHNWLDPTFLSLGDCWFCLIWVFEVSLRLTLILKGGLCFLRLLPMMTDLSVVMPLQDVAPGKSWLGGRFFEGLQNYMKNKKEGNVNKILLGDFNYTMIKWTGMVKMKHKYFIDALRTISCHSSSWIMSLRIYGEGRTHFPLSSPAKTVSFSRIQDRQSL